MRQGFEGNARTIDRALAAKVTDGMIVQPSHGTYELADVSLTQLIRQLSKGRNTLSKCQIDN